MPINILIADDYQIVREGIRLILKPHQDITVIGEARTGRDAVTLAETLLPDVLIMDISMSKLNGIEATKILSATAPSVKVIILSMHNSNEFVARAMRAGAMGYVSKDSAGSEICKAIRFIMKGRKFIGDRIEYVPSDGSPNSRKAEKGTLNSLSKRERETLQLVVEGNKNADIAEYMNISPKSVETYRARMMLKLGIDNVPALVIFAIQNGVISLQKI